MQLYAYKLLGIVSPGYAGAGWPEGVICNKACSDKQAIAMAARYADGYIHSFRVVEKTPIDG